MTSWMVDGLGELSWKRGKKQLELLLVPSLPWTAWLGCRRYQLGLLPPALVLAVPTAPHVWCSRSAPLA